MANLSTTVSWDTIRSITHPKVAQKIADNITAKIPLLYFLDRMGNKEMEQGGYNYMLPVFKELMNAQAYTGQTVLTSPEADPFTTAIYERKQLTVPIVATGTKLLMNSGSNPEAIINYMAAIVEACEESMKNTMGGSANGIFSSNGETDLGITGLQNIISSTPGTGTTGGLDRSTYLWWQNYATTSLVGFGTNGLAAMGTCFYNCVRGDESPTIIIMTTSGYINLNRALTATNVYNLPSPKTTFGDLAFEHIYWHGVPVMFDTYVPANTIYMLNLKYLRLMVHGERDFSFRDWITPNDQDSLVARIYWAGNLVCSNVARQGIVTGVGVDTY
jgi:hypothetical protein